MNTKTLKQLLSEEQAVSPVIGVILMVAITVILAAVIGTFVLGLGDQVSDNSPQASFSFEYSDDDASDDSELGDNDGNEGELTITHDGGDSIDNARLSVSDGSETASPFSGTVSAGSSATVTADSNDEVRVIWTSSGGDSTSTLAKWDGPDA